MSTLCSIREPLKKESKSATDSRFEKIKTENLTKGEMINDKFKKPNKSQNIYIFLNLHLNAS